MFSSGCAVPTLLHPLPTWSFTFQFSFFPISTYIFHIMPFLRSIWESHTYIRELLYSHWKSQIFPQLSLRLIYLSFCLYLHFSFQPFLESIQYVPCYAMLFEISLPRFNFVYFLLIILDSIQALSSFLKSHLTSLIFFYFELLWVYP